MDVTHLITGASGILGTLGITRAWRPIAAFFGKRADRHVRVEVAKIHAHEVEQTGRHQALTEAAHVWQGQAEFFSKRLDACEQKHADCEKRQDATEKQVRDWEDRMSASEVTFQDAIKRGEDCEKDRAHGEARLTALEGELRELRRQGLR